MRHIFVPNPNRMSPLNCSDCMYGVNGKISNVNPGDEVHISVVFDWDKPVAESMARYYREDRGATVLVGGPAYEDPGGEFTPGMYCAPGVVITHRGCVRNCEWCYVPRREGQRIRHLEVKPGNILQDNNILACNRAHKDKVWAMLRKQKAVSLRGGLDARLLKDEDIENIRSLRLFDLWTAYDAKESESSSLLAIRRLRAAGIPQQKIRCYVLIGFDDETRGEAEGRLWDCFNAGAIPFAQLYDRYTGTEEETKKFKRLARIWSRPAATKGRFSEMCDKILKNVL